MNTSEKADTVTVHIGINGNALLNRDFELQWKGVPNGHDVSLQAKYSDGYGGCRERSLLAGDRGQGQFNLSHAQFVKHNQSISNL